MSGLVVQSTIAKIKSTVPALISIQGVADLSALIASGNLPVRVPAAWVISVGATAEPAVDMTALTRQRVTEIVGIVVVHKVGNDGSGAKAEAGIDTVIDTIRANVVGWSIDGSHDPFEMQRVTLLGIQAGAVFKQLDLVTRWQLRQPNS